MASTSSFFGPGAPSVYSGSTKNKTPDYSGSFSSGAPGYSGAFSSTPGFSVKGAYSDGYDFGDAFAKYKMAGSPDYSGTFTQKPGFDIKKAFTGGYDSSEEESGGSYYDQAKNKLFNLASRKKEEEEKRGGGVAFGQGITGRTSQIGENTWESRPDYFSPMVLQGVQGGGGLGSAIGGLAGIAASFIPGLGPGIAAALPAIGSGVGGLFN